MRASFRCSVGARRIQSRSGRTPISSEFACISTNFDEALAVLVRHPVAGLDEAAGLDVREELLGAGVHTSMLPNDR